MVRLLALASCVLTLAGVGGSGIAVARTWYVAVDGTGDAPTIAAAIDSSSSGDVILVGPGTHYVAKFDSGVILKPSTSLLSELGPTSTFLKPGAAFPPAQPTMIDVVAGCTVTGFDIEGGSVQTITTSGGGTEVSNNIVRSFGIAVLAGGTGVIRYNVCIGGGASIMLATYSLDLQIHNNILLNGLYSGNSSCPSAVSAYCNLINGQSDCVVGYGNFTGEPLFCGSTDFHLRNDSPCAPGNHPDGLDCGLIGPLPVACGTVSAKQTTWGAVKALYRN